MEISLGNSSLQNSELRGFTLNDFEKRLDVDYCFEISFAIQLYTGNPPPAQPCQLLKVQDTFWNIFTYGLIMLIPMPMLSFNILCY